LATKVTRSYLMRTAQAAASSLAVGFIGRRSVATNWVRFVSTYFGVTIMNSVQATWEDEENNRQVELVVNYRLDAKRVEINEVTPTRVNFLCPTSGNTTRSIGIWTNGARRLLNRQIAGSGRLATLSQEIADGRLVEIKHPAAKAAGKPTPILQA
jgi:hypothetical protein